MNLGKNKIYILILYLSFLNNFSNAEDKITTVPLINLEDLIPSYEEVEKDTIKNEKETILRFKNKDIKINNSKNTSVHLLWLDKITTKTTEIELKIGQKKIFGMLEIKAIKCGISESINEKGVAAYIQVKDISDRENEKVFVFNGWTFSSSPSLKPIDHPIYDIWLVNCKNV